MTKLDTDIAQWRAAITRSAVVDGPDADELESHLREQVGELVDVGLTEDEAFQIAVQRLGKVDQLTAEFAREHGERLWKQLTLAASPADGSRGRAIVEMIVFALLAAAAVQVGRVAAGIPESMAPWFPRNLGLLILPFLVGYFAWRRGLSSKAVLIGTAALAGLGLIANVYPFAENGQTQVLVAIYLPVVLWFFVGAAYLVRTESTSPRRMDFVRFTGEWAIYWVLLALGGGVLIGLTVLVIEPIAPDAVEQIILWVLPSGGAAAVIVAAWLVEAKKGVIENLAPVLTAIFTPLFALMLFVAAVVYLVGGIGAQFDRELLIGFDLLLIVVVGLVLYALSARDPNKAPGVLDIMRLVAVIAALLLDVLVLASMLGRVAEFGFTANRTAALGLNLVLVVNLAVTAWLQIAALRGKASSGALERWQTRYLLVFGAWAAIVVVALPVVFAFK